METETQKYVYAGFWIRFLAVLIDGIAITAASTAIKFVLNISISDPPALYSLFEAIAGIIYYVALTTRFGQTLGKMVVGIKVIRQDGQANSWGNIFLREVVGKFLSSIILGIGYIMAGFSKEKKALHDRIAGTYVVKASEQAAAQI